MATLVLMHKAVSNYEDDLGVVYACARVYRTAVREAVGDWIVCLEPVKAGVRGYSAVAQIADISPKPGVDRR